MSAAPKIRIFESEVQPVRIDELRIDEKALQSRAETDPDIVRVYAERRRGKPKQPGSPFPPVLVFIVEGVWWLADGFHRVAAALKLGEETISAIVRRAGSMVEAIDAGAAINMSKENLRGYQEADRRRLAELYIRCGAGRPGEGSWDWSDTEIARRCGISNGWVARIRDSLRSSGIPLPNRVMMFSDGKKTGRSRAYRHGVEWTRGSNGAVVASIGGVREVYCGKGAEERIVARRKGIEAAKVALAEEGSFRAWLANRSILVMGLGRGRGFSPGGTRVGNAYVTALPSAKTETTLAAIGRCVLARSCLNWIDRTIIVGYRDGDRVGGAALNLAAALLPPVEHMTVEEFVERALSGEFGETPPDLDTTCEDASDPESES